MRQTRAFHRAILSFTKMALESKLLNRIRQSWSHFDAKKMLPPSILLMYVPDECKYVVALLWITVYIYNRTYNYPKKYAA